jgi:hypothetical protein
MFSMESWSLGKPNNNDQNKIGHIEFCAYFEFPRNWLFFKKTDNKPKLINLKENLKKNINFQVLTNKNVLTSILNLGAILNFHV